MASVLHQAVRLAETTLLLSVTRSHLHSTRYVRSDAAIERYSKEFRERGLGAFMPTREDRSLGELLGEMLQDRPLRLSFSTPYEPLDSFRDDFMKSPELHRAVVHYHPHKTRQGRLRLTGKRRILIYLHGWGRPSLRVERMWHFPILQHSYDADVLALELPYHMSRNPGGFSGQGMLDGDPVRTMEGFRQAVIEAITIYQALRNSREVGFVGISLGAHLLVMINVLLAEDLFGLAALVGSPLKENLRQLTISPNLLKALRHQGTARLLSILDFNRLSVKHYNRRFYLVGGKHDPIIKPRTVMNLGRHLKCPTYLIPSGHFTFSLLLPYITTRLVPWTP